MAERAGAAESPLALACAWTRPAVALPLFVAVALIGGRLESFSRAATLLILVMGGVLTGLGLRGRGVRAGGARAPAAGAGGPAPEPPAMVDGPPAAEARHPGAGARWWLAPALLFLLVEGYSLARGSTEGHPSVSILLDPVLAGAPVRTLAYFGWLTVFWGLARR